MMIQLERFDGVIAENYRTNILSLKWNIAITCTEI